jgi:hypothetical protein
MIYGSGGAQPARAGSAPGAAAKFPYHFRDFLISGDLRFARLYPLQDSGPLLYAAPLLLQQFSSVAQR